MDYWALMQITRIDVNNNNIAIFKGLVSLEKMFTQLIVAMPHFSFVLFCCNRYENKQ